MAGQAATGSGQLSSVIVVPAVDFRMI